MLKGVDFFLNSAILFSVREIKNNMKNETEADMIKEFYSELVNIDIDGKTWTKGEMIQVVSVEIGGKVSI